MTWVGTSYEGLRLSEVGAFSALLGLCARFGFEAAEQMAGLTSMEGLSWSREGRRATGQICRPRRCVIGHTFSV